MWTAITGFFAAYKGGITLFLVALIAISMAVVARNWSCREHKDPRPPKPVEYTVIKALNGASIECKRGKLRGRVIYLQDVAAPMEGQDCFEESRDNLAKLAGDTIRVERERKRILLKGESQQTVEAEARPPIEGVVYGASNICLQEAQLTNGLVELTSDDVPDSWQAAEKFAQKKMLGIWATKPIPPEPEKSIWAKWFTRLAIVVFAFLLGWFTWDIWKGVKSND